MDNKLLILAGRLLLFIGFFSFPLTLFAQDTHYWMQQYGTRSALLGGAVLGGAPDNSTVYYNPAGLGFIDELSISVNANVYRIENITIENALGQQADFKSNQFAAVPIMVGGLLKPKEDGWRIGYSLIAPVDFNFKGNARADGEFDIIDNLESPGAEPLVGESEKNSRISEVSLALGLGKKLSERWAFGITNLFSLRNQTFSRHIIAHIELNNPENTLAGTTLYQYANSFHLRYAARAGVAYRQGNWSAGLTVTSPSLSLLGKGTLAADLSIQNLKLDNPDRSDGYGSDRQEKLESTYKAPFSVAAGLQYRFPKAQLGLAAEYFGSIDQYAMLRAEPAEFFRYGNFGNGRRSEDLLLLLNGAEPVFNLVIGYEYLLNERWNLYASARSDMSYLDESINQTEGFKATISSWDIYHFVLGTTLLKDRSSLSLGLLYSTGTNNDHAESGSYENATEGDLLEGVSTITTAHYQSIGLLLGFTFHFRKF